MYMNAIPRRKFDEQTVAPVTQAASISISHSPAAEMIRQTMKPVIQAADRIYPITLRALISLGFPGSNLFHREMAT